MWKGHNVFSPQILQRSIPIKVDKRREVAKQVFLKSRWQFCMLWKFLQKRIVDRECTLADWRKNQTDTFCAIHAIWKSMKFRRSNFLWKFLKIEKFNKNFTFEVEQIYSQYSLCLKITENVSFKRRTKRATFTIWVKKVP